MNEYLKNSPREDKAHIEARAALAFGYYGCLRADDLWLLEWKNIDEQNDGFWVELTNRKTGVLDDPVEFLVPKNSDESICGYTAIAEFKKCAGFTDGRVFRTLRKRGFIAAPKGVHAVRKIPAFIARFLGLKDPSRYTGQCFRRTSATPYADKGGSRINLKRLGGWKSDSVCEGYINNSKKFRREVAATLAGSETGTTAQFTVSSVSTGVLSPLTGFTSATAPLVLPPLNFALHTLPPLPSLPPLATEGLVGGQALALMDTSMISPPSTVAPVIPGSGAVDGFGGGRVSSLAGGKENSGITLNLSNCSNVTFNFGAPQNVSVNQQKNQLPVGLPSPFL